MTHGLLGEVELLQLSICCSLLWFPVLPLVLAFNGYNLKGAHFSGLDGFVADEFIKVSRIPTQILPSKNFLSVLSNLRSEVEALIE